MAKRSVLRDAVRDEVKRPVLREAEHRYRNELMDDEERQLLLDRIKRLTQGSSGTIDPLGQKTPPFLASS